MPALLLRHFSTSCNRCHHAASFPTTETFLRFSFFTFDCHRWHLCQSVHHLDLTSWAGAKQEPYGTASRFNLEKVYCLTNFS